MKVLLFLVSFCSLFAGTDRTKSQSQSVSFVFDHSFTIPDNLALKKELFYKIALAKSPTHEASNQSDGLHISNFDPDFTSELVNDSKTDNNVLCYNFALRAINDSFSEIVASLPPETKIQLRVEGNEVLAKGQRSKTVINIHKNDLGNISDIIINFKSSYRVRNVEKAHCYFSSKNRILNALEPLIKRIADYSQTQIEEQEKRVDSFEESLNKLLEGQQALGHISFTKSKYDLTEHPESSFCQTEDCYIQFDGTIKKVREYTHDRTSRPKKRKTGVFFFRAHDLKSHYSTYNGRRSYGVEIGCAIYKLDFAVLNSLKKSKEMLRPAHFQVLYVDSQYYYNRWYRYTRKKCYDSISPGDSLDAKIKGYIKHYGAHLDTVPLPKLSSQRHLPSFDIIFEEIKSPQVRLRESIESLSARSAYCAVLARRELRKVYEYFEPVLAKNFSRMQLFLEGQSGMAGLPEIRLTLNSKSSKIELKTFWSLVNDEYVIPKTDLLIKRVNHWVNAIEADFTTLDQTVTEMILK